MVKLGESSKASQFRCFLEPSSLEISRLSPDIGMVPLTQVPLKLASGEGQKVLLAHVILSFLQLERNIHIQYGKLPYFGVVSPEPHHYQAITQFCTLFSFWKPPFFLFLDICQFQILHVTGILRYFTYSTQHNVSKVHPHYIMHQNFITF